MRLPAFTVAAAICLAYGGSAFAADPPKDAAAPKSDAAAAQALFYEARQLMKDNKFGLACPKLEESLRLDYGIGTEFNLADCNEKVGKVATAWSGYLSVAAAAHSSKQLDREKVARERAKALEPRLPKLTVEVPAGTAPPSLEVKRDGVIVGQAAWNTAVPTDPGPHRVVASAPGKLSWEGTVTTIEGKPAKITVPKLQDAPVAVAPVPAPVAVTPAPRPAQEATSTTTLTSFPEPVVEGRGQGQRTAGWIVAGLGIASLGVGAGFGINSLAQRSQANDHCDSRNLCDAQGLKDRRSAITSGNVSTITSIAGAGALIGGLVLVLTAPHNRERKDPTTVTGSIRAVPQVATNGAGLSFEGILP